MNKQNNVKRWSGVVGKLVAGRPMVRILKFGPWLRLALIVGITGKIVLLINVDLEDDAPAITWQQFYPSGPRSFLPLAGNKASLVWYDTPRIAQLTAMPAVLGAGSETPFSPKQLPACKVTHISVFPADPPTCPTLLPRAGDLCWGCGAHHSSVGRAG